MAAQIVIRSQFVIQAQLHATLFGDIWICRDLQNDNQLVAVKQVRLDLARQALAHGLVLDSPWDERRTLDTLLMLGPHDNVLQTYQHFQQDDSWFVVMEYCEGGDLWQTLERLPHSRLPEIQALPLFSQIVRGVHLLHDNGIAHRDLSLENVLLSRNGGAGGRPFGTAKICDFGLSTNAARVCHERVGKAYYMAPEVVAGVPYDPLAADVWSLGIILFVMLTGSPLTPLASEEEKEFVALMKFGVGRILESWRMGGLVSLATVHLLVRMLTVNPATRLTVGDVAEHPALMPF
uniref:Protein kinase domain-containing protein n=1 Tax=Phytophthora ramorum TaxID=164328 RepID=H3GDM1_PHYRM